MQTDEFARRRRTLMQMAGDGAIVILPAAGVKLRNRDTAFPFRQNSDFYYLTGFCEPDAVLVLLPGREQGETILFCREQDPELERWDGPMVGLQGACDDFGMDDAFPISDIDEILPNLIEGRGRVFYTVGRDRDFDQQVMGWVNHVRREVSRGASPPGEFISLDHPLHDLRLFKSRAEIGIMRRSAKLACNAHLRAMQACQPGMHEYELAAEILHEFNRADAVAAYEPIVGGGVNACVLHYVRNQDRLADGDLVLIDAGAELEYYASDVTRTFPVNGRFTAVQRDVYEIVLAAQQAAIDAVRPGVSWDAPHEAAVTAITAGLVDLGALEGTVDDLIEQRAYREWYPHRTGHWLGLDVHDVGDYRIDGQPRELEPGMAFTIEPGLYFGPRVTPGDAPWHGIGVRIEDDVVVTRDGCQILSDGVPRSVEEIEHWMAS